jgi:hypothetical protein
VAVRRFNPVPARLHFDFVAESMAQSPTLRSSEISSAQSQAVLDLLLEWPEV